MVAFRVAILRRSPVVPLGKPAIVLIRTDEGGKKRKGWQMSLSLTREISCLARGGWAEASGEALTC